MSIEALRITNFVIVPLTGEILSFGADIFTGAGMIVLAVAIFALEGATPASCAIVKRASVIIDVFADTTNGHMPWIGVEVLANVGETNEWLASTTALLSMLAL